MSYQNHHNHNYSAGVPVPAGDRYWAQDLGRDFTYHRATAGRIAAMATDIIPPVLLTMGGVITQTGLTNQINIPAFSALIPTQITVPGDFGAATPPATTTQDVIVFVDQGAQSVTTGIDLTDFDGVTVNYIKAAVTEEAVYSRARAKVAGTYDYEVVDSAIVYVDSTEPTDYEICLGMIRGESNSHFWIVSYEGRGGGTGTAHEAISAGDPVGFLPDGTIAKSVLTERVSGRSTLSAGAAGTDVVLTGGPNNETFIIGGDKVSCLTFDSGGVVTPVFEDVSYIGAVGYPLTDTGIPNAQAVADPDQPGVVLFVWQDFLASKIYMTTGFNNSGSLSVQTPTEYVSAGPKANIKALSIRYIRKGKFLFTYLSDQEIYCTIVTLSGTTITWGAEVLLTQMALRSEYGYHGCYDINIYSQAIIAQATRQLHPWTGRIWLVDVSGDDPVETYYEAFYPYQYGKFITGYSSGRFLNNQRIFQFMVGRAVHQWRVSDTDVSYIGQFSSLINAKTVDTYNGNACSGRLTGDYSIVLSTPGITSFNIAMSADRVGTPVLMGRVHDSGAVYNDNRNELTAEYSKNGVFIACYRSAVSRFFTSHRAVQYNGIAIHDASPGQPVTFITQGSFRLEGANKGDAYQLAITASPSEEPFQKIKEDLYLPMSVIGRCTSDGVLTVENFLEKHKDEQKFHIYLYGINLATTQSYNILYGNSYAGTDNVLTRLLMVADLDTVVVMGDSPHVTASFSKATDHVTVDFKESGNGATSNCMVVEVSTGGPYDYSDYIDTEGGARIRLSFTVPRYRSALMPDMI